MSLLHATGPEQAHASFTWDRLWALFDGEEGNLNIAHECLDRHDPLAVAARIAHDGGAVELSFGTLSRSTSRFAHQLEALDIRHGEPVGIMMEPSFGFFTALFGILKRGAVAVPLYTLFGPQAVRDRLDDCRATLLITDADSGPLGASAGDCRVVRYDSDLAAQIDRQPVHYQPKTAARDPAVLQYTSGTTRQLPEAVPHDHRSIVTLARAGLFALGLARGDRFFCPSSPAWGHGLWHGTIAPMSLGVAVGTSSGRFSIDRLVDALRDLRITNLAAASTIYRMLLRSGRLDKLSTLQKASYTGEELHAGAQRAFQAATGIPVSGMYGTTETGVILGNYPGFADYEPRTGSLGKPLPGCDVAVLTEDGEVAPVGVQGEISVRRRSQWFGAKDMGTVDNDGYFHYLGRADDVIIASGWTISPLEVERMLLSHPDVSEAAVVGIPDDIRGQVVKAFIVARRNDERFATELQHLVRTELSAHEYPREVEFVGSLPKTPNGKIDRRILRQPVSGEDGG